MLREQLVKKKIPDEPGVYFFMGRNKEILYIGRATSLKRRIGSYFDLKISEKRSSLIEKMVREAKHVDWTVTDSVLEAMILEVNLIRSHKPGYNTRAKDDKSYNHLVITKEAYPRVLVVRGKDLHEMFDERDLQYCFGPFPSSSLFRDALKIVRKLFKFYDTKIPLDQVKSKLSRGKIDFNRQIGLYPGVQTKDEYADTIKHIRLFFEGKKSALIGELEHAMMRHAKREEFEKAEEIKRKIFALQHIEDVALMKNEARVYSDDRTFRIEAYDVAHLGGSEMVGVMTVTHGAEPAPSEYRKFKIRTVDRSNDTGALREVLERRLAHREWPRPQLIVVDGSAAQKNAAEHVLKKHSVVIPVVGVVKDERHRPVRIVGAQKLVQERRDAILLTNNEAHRFAINYHRTKRNSRYKRS